MNTYHKHFSWGIMVQYGLWPNVNLQSRGSVGFCLWGDTRLNGDRLLSQRVKCVGLPRGKCNIQFKNKLLPKDGLKLHQSERCSD